MVGSATNNLTYFLGKCSMEPGDPHDDVSKLLITDELSLIRTTPARCRGFPEVYRVRGQVGWGLKIGLAR